MGGWPVLTIEVHVKNMKVKAFFVTYGASMPVPNNGVLWHDQNTNFESFILYISLKWITQSNRLP